MDECDAECPQDLDGDGSVGAFDLAMVLGSWRPCEGCPADLDGDGEVGPFDLESRLGRKRPSPRLLALHPADEVECTAC